ncbi:DUF5818 domain-containing protein [Pseudoponticoccus marisrubri]|nr:DUF5818 domain-containing protein [Pseudoponticoccus marisrubri]
MTHPSLIRAAALSALALGAATPAAAQSRCGDSYTMQPGDTLYQVSQSCRVAMSRIMALNPDLDSPRDIAIGTRLQLVGDGAAERPAPRDTRTYRVEEGDTLFAIAQALGVSLFELINENEDVNPFALAVGEMLDVPGDRPGASVSVSPNAGAPDTQVTVRARNLRPGDYVTIGAGRSASDWSALREVQVARDGDLTATVPVPDWAEPGDALIYVVDTDRGMSFKSDLFEVTGGAPDPVTLDGRVNAGVECPILRTRDGDSYALTSDSVAFTPGEYVEITGTRAEMSYCQQGAATIRVDEIREVRPPEGDEIGGMTLEGRIEDGVECPVLVTPDGDRWALTSDGIGLTEGEYVEIRGETVPISTCMQGLGTISVTDLREVPQ